MISSANSSNVLGEISSSLTALGVKNHACSCESFAFLPYPPSPSGLAYDQGLLPNMDEPVCKSLPDVEEFNNSARHRTITWAHLLQQTSEWEGELWGKARGRDGWLGNPRLRSGS